MTIMATQKGKYHKRCEAMMIGQIMCLRSSKMTHNNDNIKLIQPNLEEKNYEISQAAWGAHLVNTDDCPPKGLDEHAMLIKCAPPN